MKPEISIIILCHNHWDHTKKCVEALLRYAPYDRCEVIIWDNASVDDTRDQGLLLTKQYAWIHYYYSSENLGFSIGNNEAAKYAMGDYLFFLNNDTEISQNSIDYLSKHLKENSQIGAVGAKLIYPNGQLQEAGGLIFNDASGWNFGRGDDPRDPRYNTVREVDYCSAAALMVRKTLFNRLGGFDPQYSPAYYEDTDLCFGLREIGYLVIYEPLAQVIHFEGGTAGKDSSLGYKRFQEVNKQKFISKWSHMLNKQPSPPQDALSVWKIADRRQRDVGKLHNLQRAQAYKKSLIYGDGCYADEGGWRWLSPKATLFVLNSAQSLKSIELTLLCSQLNQYQDPPPLIVTLTYSPISRYDENKTSLTFVEDDQSQTIVLPLPQDNIDFVIKIQASSVYWSPEHKKGSDKRLLALRLNTPKLL